MTRTLLVLITIALLLAVSFWVTGLFDQRTEDWPRTLSAWNLKELGLAMHAYHQQHGRLPAAAVFSENGMPLLSWRVLLLPYLEQDQLFRQFLLEEPWDSPHNIKLIQNIPHTYLPVEGSPPHAPFTTFWQVFVGKGTVFDGRDGLCFKDLKGRMANTFLIVEAAHAVPWTKPEDLRYDEGQSLPKLGGLRKNIFLATMLDASTRSVRKETTDQTLRSAIVRHGAGPGLDW